MKFENEPQTPSPQDYHGGELTKPEKECMESRAVRAIYCYEEIAERRRPRCKAG